MAKTILSIVLRVVVAMATLTAAIVMLLSNDKPTNHRSLSCIVDDNFHRWNGYFIVVQFIACSLNVIAIVLPSKSKLWSPIFLIDMIVLILQLTSWTAILVCYLYMKSGNPYAGYTNVCNLNQGFCNMILGALVAGGIASFSSFLFLCYSLQKTLNILLHEDIPN